VMTLLEYKASVHTHARPRRFGVQIKANDEHCIDCCCCLAKPTFWAIVVCLP